MARDGFYRPESFISPGSEYGLLRAATPDRTVWLYAKIPWTSALLDGAGDSKRKEAEQSFMAFFDGLAGEVSVAGMRYRDLLKSEYREFHLLTGSMPIPYRPPVMQQDDSQRLSIDVAMAKLRFRDKEKGLILDVWGMIK